VILVAGGLLRGERIDALPTLQGVLSVGYLTVFGSIIAFTAYVWLLHNVRPVLASSYAYVNPVIAVALGAWIAHERFSSADIGAMAVILAGVVVITLARIRRA
ncbi:EamA family transporter, partial [Stenotrophomonas pictorum]